MEDLNNFEGGKKKSLLPDELASLIQNFEKLEVSVKEITTAEHKANHQRVVEATYKFSEKSYTTKPLYYKNVCYAPNVKNPKELESHFGEEVYWLDIEKHNWPKSSGETDLDNLIVDDMTDDEGF